jgi:pimeloyl-ACP methyl ester carboxylesterase
VRADDGVAVMTYELAGAAGRPALFVHAAGFCGAVLAPLATACRASLAALLVDLRAHGRSGRPPGGPTWEGFGLDVEAVLASDTATRWIGVGHSVGATALLRAEIARPGSFSLLYLYEPILLTRDEWARNVAADALVEAARARRESFGSRDEAFARFSSRPPLASCADITLSAYVDEGLEENPDGGVRLCCRREDEAALYLGGRLDRTIERVAEVACPVVVAYGGASVVFPPVRAAGLAARFASGRVAEIDGLGHLGPMEEPARVADGLLAAVEAER